MNGNIDGIMTRNVNVALKVLKLKIPALVLFQARSFDPRLNYIIYDNKAIAAIAAEHFFKTGQENFAYCGYRNMQWSMERGQNFAFLIKKRGFKMHTFQYADLKIYHANPTEEKRLADWLKMLPKPVAIFACNDDMGLQIIETCKTAQLNVPQQVAVLGVDNDHINNMLSDVPLSSISLNFEKGGFEAASILEKMMAGTNEAGKKIIVRPITLIVRRSSSQFRFEEPQVALACDFIRRNAHKRLQVSDVVQNSLISRRSMELAFQKHLGCSIHDEIISNQLDKICYLLKETNMTISQIASLMGYSDIKHICRIFKKNKDITCTTYRKLYQRSI